MTPSKERALKKNVDKKQSAAIADLKSRVDQLEGQLEGQAHTPPKEEKAKGKT